MGECVSHVVVTCTAREGAGGGGGTDGPASRSGGVGDPYRNNERSRRDRLELEGVAGNKNNHVIIM